MNEPLDPRVPPREEPVTAAMNTVPTNTPPPVLPSREQSEHTEQLTQSTVGVEQHERVITDEAGVQHRARTVRDVGAERRMNLRIVYRLILLFFGIVEGLIGLRIVLKLLGANPEVGFARFIYDASALFLGPFFGLVGSPASGGMVLEVPSLIAMLFYGVVAWLILRVIWPLFDRPTTRSTSTYDRFDG